jgi:hypothetical protein
MSKRGLIQIWIALFLKKQEVKKKNHVILSLAPRLFWLLVTVSVQTEVLADLELT